MLVYVLSKDGPPLMPTERCGKVRRMLKTGLPRLKPLGFHSEIYMSKEAKFLIYCTERYRYYKNLSGSEVADLFSKYHVDEYIIKYYISLSTLGDFAIIEDIDGFIAEQTTPNS